MNIKCPRCGSTDTVPVQGGSGAGAEFYCEKCRKGLATLPRFHTKFGERDYREAICYIYFVTGRYDAGYPQVTMLKRKNDIILDVRPGYDQAALFIHREITVEEWVAVAEVLFCKLYLHKWKKRFVDPTILDGEQWELNLGLDGRRKRTYSGSNAYPPYWNELREVFRPFFDEVGIDF